MSRVGALSIGTLLVIAGPIAGLVPGPGGVVILLGGLGVLASELLAIARVLDWSEPRARKLGRLVRGSWQRARTATRVALYIGCAAAVAVCVLAVRAHAASRA